MKEVGINIEKMRQDAVGRLLDAIRPFVKQMAGIEALEELLAGQAQLNGNGAAPALPQQKALGPGRPPKGARRSYTRGIGVGRANAIRSILADFPEGLSWKELIAAALDAPNFPWGKGDPAKEIRNSVGPLLRQGDLYQNGKRLILRRPNIHISKAE